MPPTAPPPAARVENAVAAAAPRAVCWIREPPSALPEWTNHITASLTSCRSAASRGLARNSSTTGPPILYHPAQPRPREDGGPSDERPGSAQAWRVGQVVAAVPGRLERPGLSRSAGYIRVDLAGGLAALPARTWGGLSLRLVVLERPVLLDPLLC